MLYAASAVLPTLGLWLFVRPLRRISGGVDGVSLMELLKDATVGAAPRSKWGLAIRLTIALGCVVGMLPACVLLVATLAPPHSRRIVLVCGGTALILLSVATLGVFLVSGMSFGWGTPPTKPATLAGRLAPTFPFVSGVAAILTGAIADH